MPAFTIRAWLGCAVVAAALVLAPMVPASADTGLPTGYAGIIENTPTAIDHKNREGTGEVVTYTIAVPPRHGTAVVIGPTASTVLYTPDHDFVGDDSYTIASHGGVTTAPLGVMQLYVETGVSTGPRLSNPRSTFIPAGGVDGDASTRLTISGDDFIDSQPDGHTHVLPAGEDVLEGYHLGGATWLFEEYSRSAYDPVQVYAEISGAVGPGGGLALGTHRLVPIWTASAGDFSLDFSAFHASCSQQPGTVDVQRFDVAPNGDPVAVDLTFSETCDADTVHAMTGSLHWRAATGSPTASAPSTTVPSPSGDPSATPIGSAPTSGAGSTVPVSSTPAPDPGSPVTAPTPAPVPSPHATQKQRSRTSLSSTSRTSRTSGRVRLTIRTAHAAAGSSTWTRWGAANVRIEERTAHGWHVIATVRTSNRGSATVWVHASKHGWRAVTTGTASVTGSTSPTRR